MLGWLVCPHALVGVAYQMVLSLDWHMEYGGAVAVSTERLCAVELLIGMLVLALFY